MTRADLVACVAAADRCDIADALWIVALAMAVECEDAPPLYREGLCDHAIEAALGDQSMRTMMRARRRRADVHCC